MATPTAHTDAQGQNNIDRNVRQYTDLDRTLRSILFWPCASVNASQLLGVPAGIIDSCFYYL